MAGSHRALPKLGKRNTMKAFAIDWFLWAYSILVFYKIIYVHYIAQIRYPEFYWGQVHLSLLAGLIVAAVFFNLKNCSLGKRFRGIAPDTFNLSFFKNPSSIFGVVVLVITFIAGFNRSQISINEFLSSTGLAGARRIFGALFQPNFSIFNDALFAAIETIYMAFIATVFALPLAFVLSFLAARNLMISNKISFLFYTLNRFVLNVTRSIEPLVWAIIFSVWVGIGPFAGMLALFIHSVVSLAKLYSEAIEGVDNGPIEAMTATGAHPIQVIWYGVVPQIVLPFLSFTIYRWDINVRMATVIGLVGGGGIGTMLMQYQGLAKWNEVGLLVIVIAAIVWIMDYSSAKIREALK